MSTASDLSAIQPLDALFHQALAQRASDMHFENGVQQFRVRFRIDGLLQVAATPPLALRDAMLTRIKVLARMDIAEKRLPQDGRIAYLHQHRMVDLRVSSLPTLHGEKLVVRILNFSQTCPPLAALGYEASDQIQLLQALQRSHGLVLMTGPTGSGKTLSLYSCLDVLNRPELNIVTVEDPVEIHLPGVNQVSVNERAGLTFASTLRALLRQDPDVLMVGEIRDFETATIALQAAQTGHLVLSTLHTNDAPSTLTRLQHMGVAPYQVAAGIVAVVAQRLVRRLCDACKRPLNTCHLAAALDALPAAERTWLLAQNISHGLHEAVGCPACSHSGYLGRVGVFQLMPISEALQQLILKQASTTALATQAMREGMPSLRTAAWLKALQGLTSAQEVQAHTDHG